MNTPGEPMPSAPAAIFRVPLWGRAPIMLIDETMRQTCCACAVMNELAAGAVRMAALPVDATIRWQERALLALASAAGKKGEPAGLSLLAAEWMLGSLSAGLDYWRRLADSAEDSQTSVIRCLEDNFGNPAEDLPDLLNRLAVDPLLAVEFELANERTLSA